MFAVIRHYHFDSKNSTEIDRRVREEFVPLIKKAKGFVRYYWLDNGKGDLHRCSSSRFDQLLLESWHAITRSKKKCCRRSVLPACHRQ
jgi:hypothetical protein